MRTKPHCFRHPVQYPCAWPVRVFGFISRIFPADSLVLRYIGLDIAAPFLFQTCSAEKTPPRSIRLTGEGLFPYLSHRLTQLTSKRDCRVLPDNSHSPHRAPRILEPGNGIRPVCNRETPYCTFLAYPEPPQPSTSWKEVRAQSPSIPLVWFAEREHSTTHSIGHPLLAGSRICAAPGLGIWIAFA
jgi:hypothetical protein